MLNKFVIVTTFNKIYNIDFLFNNLIIFLSKCYLFVSENSHVLNPLSSKCVILKGWDLNRLRVN